MKYVKTYWWTGRPNFGDGLAPYLIRRFSSVWPEWARPEEAQLLTIGSVLDTPGVRANKGPIVLGSSSLFDNDFILTARWWGVRGPLTAKNAAIPSSLVSGDPGLLADELVRVRKRPYNLGILPHWSDDVLATRGEFLQYDPLIINPAWDPLTVVEAIGSCKKLVTSSLHGVIVADSYNIPRRTEVAPRLVNEEGGMFKFRDYNASVKVPFKTGVTQRASRQEVETLQHTLFDLYEGLEDRLHAL